MSTKKQHTLTQTHTHYHTPTPTHIGPGRIPTPETLSYGTSLSTTVRIKITIVAINSPPSIAFNIPGQVINPQNVLIDIVRECHRSLSICTHTQTRAHTHIHKHTHTHRRTLRELCFSTRSRSSNYYYKVTTYHTITN